MWESNIWSRLIFYYMFELRLKWYSRWLEACVRSCMHVQCNAMQCNVHLINGLNWIRAGGNKKSAIILNRVLVRWFKSKAHTKQQRTKVFHICVVDFILFDFHFAIKLSFKLFFNLDCCGIVSFAPSMICFGFLLLQLHSLSFSRCACVWLCVCVHIYFSYYFSVNDLQSSYHNGTTYSNIWGIELCAWSLSFYCRFC